MNRIWSSLIIMGVLGMLSACNFNVEINGGPTPISQDAILTAAAQTLVVQFTQSAAERPSDTPEPTLPGSESSQSPSPTPTLTHTSAPQVTPTTLPTPTQTVPIISASVATNCRRGPSLRFEPPVGILDVNQTSQVHGRNAEGTWWYIQNPANPSSFCWVWGDTTIVEGSTQGIPIITPPPLPATATPTGTPVANFTASFETVHDCNGVPTAIFRIVNQGSRLESLTLWIQDLTDSEYIFGPGLSDAPFMFGPDECPPGGEAIEPGQTRYVGGAIGPGNSGHTGLGTLLLCTGNSSDSERGSCLTREAEFTIP